MKLPICTSPSIISYLHHAYPLAIVEAGDQARRYLVNSFLQLHSRENDAPGVGKEILVDFYSHDGMYPRFPLLNWAWLSTAVLRKMGSALAEQACGALDSGCYLEATLDEFYLPSRPSYQRRHLPHQNLIFGYAREEQLFHVIGFGRDASFTEYTISFADYALAMRDDLGVAFISCGNGPEYSNSQMYSPGLVRQYLGDFLESRSSFLSYQPAGSTFGVATYDIAAAQVEQRNGRDIDIRPWCVFHEHKQKLSALAAFLEREREAVFAPDTQRELQLLERDFQRLRNYLIEAHMNDTQVKVASLRENLKRITVAEAEVISALMRAAV